MINYSITTKNARLAVVRDAIDAAPGPGKVNIYDSGSVLLVSIDLAGPPCGTISDGVLTLSGMPISNAAVGDGNADHAAFLDSSDVVVADGLTVGVGGGFDVSIDGIEIHAGSTVTISSGIIRHG